MKRIAVRASVFLFSILLMGLLYFFTWAPKHVDQRFNTSAQASSYQASKAASELHQRLFVADLHADFLLWSRELLERVHYGHVDLPRLIEGNVALQTFSVVTKAPSQQNYERNKDDSDRITLLVAAQRWPIATWTSLKARTLYQAERLHDAVAQSDGYLVLIRSVADLQHYLERRQKTSNIVAGVLAIEGLHALEGQLEHVDTFFEAGYRMMGLAHFFDNEVAGSAHGINRGGLTPLGKRVIRRMETLGILIDLAHVAPDAIDDVLEMTTHPVVVSHTGVKGTCDSPRNLSDEHILRIGEGGGVIGIGYWEAAVCGTDVDAIVGAIRYVVEVAGIDHVGLGSDFDGTVHTPFDTAGLVQLTEALLIDGFSEEEIGKIMGGNVLRLLRATLPPT